VNEPTMHHSDDDEMWPTLWRRAIDALMQEKP
jgi:hypothetical protein